MVALAELHGDIRAAIESGEIERPLQICQAILAARPDNLETLLLRAELSLESGDTRGAHAGFERVLAGDPEAYLACAGLAIGFEAMRDPSGALHWFSRALDLEPSNLEIQRERGRLLEVAYPGSPPRAGMGDFAAARSFATAGFGQKALQLYRSSLREEPGRIEIKLGLAELLWRLGHTDEAQGLCAKILTVAPRVVKAQALMACVAAEEGEIERGRAMLVDVHAQDPDGRIAADLIAQTGLERWATDRVDLKISVGTPRPPRSSADVPTWAHWMRSALWQVLRLVLAEPDDAPVEMPSPPTSMKSAAPRSKTGPLGRRLEAAELEASHLEPETDEAASTLELALVSEEIMRLDVKAVLEAQTLLPRPPAADSEGGSSDDEPTEFIPSDVLTSETRAAPKPGRGRKAGLSQ